MSSLFPQKTPREFLPLTSNGSTTEERQRLLVDDTPQYSGIVLQDQAMDHQVAEIIYALFMEHHHRSHEHPRTSPRLPPETRGKRHRNYYVHSLNQFVRRYTFLLTMHASLKSRSLTHSLTHSHALTLAHLL